MSFTLTGVGIGNEGQRYAVGRVLRLQTGAPAFGGGELRAIAPEAVAVQVQQLQNALRAAIFDLEQLEQQARKGGGEVAQELGQILQMHVALLEDPSLLQEVTALITSRGGSARWALGAYLETLVREFEQMEDPYLRARRVDIEQVLARVVRHLDADCALADEATRGDAQIAVDALLAQTSFAQDPVIVVAADLEPAQMLALGRSYRQSVAQGGHGSRLAGLLTERGSANAHTAIVARAIGIPALVAVDQLMRLTRQGDWVVLDTQAAVLLVCPSEELLLQYQMMQQGQIAPGRTGAPSDHASPTTLSQLQQSLIGSDGQRIAVWANIDHPDEVTEVVAMGIEGIGLFRSEFLFLGRQGLPTEEEQYLAYAQVVKAMAGKVVTIRTLDVGGDKLPGGEWYGLGATQDGAGVLGLRAVRWCLAHPQEFAVQLRALLRAAQHGPIDVLIPMLTHVSELMQCKALIEAAYAELREQRLACGPIALGAMIEVPAAALSIEAFLRQVDFVSIGTNDLTQYVLAVDRAQAQVAHLYDARNEAVLALVHRVITHARASGKRVCLCGELAADEAAVKTLLDMGLREFSVQPHKALKVMQRVCAALQEAPAG